MSSVSRLEERCLERGIRLTGQRRVIARVVWQADDRPDVEEVYRRASGADHQISLAAVYRTLRLFEEAGLITRYDLGDGRARYGGYGEPGEAVEESGRCRRVETYLDPYAPPIDASKPDLGERPRP